MASDETPKATTPETPPADTDETPSEPPPEKLPKAVAVKGKPYVYRKDPDAEPEKFPARAPAHPWERQPNETMRAYRAFEVYRSMDPEERSLRRMSDIIEDVTGPSGKVRRHHPYPWPRITTWSRMHGWVARADAWDTEVARRQANKQLRDREKMHDRHRDLAMLMQQKVVERMRDMRPEELTRRDLDRWAEKAVKIERQARGLDRIGSEGNAPNINVGVGVQVGTGGAQPVPTNEPKPLDDTPIGEYLLQHPSDVSDAVTSIQDLLAFVSGESSGKTP